MRPEIHCHAIGLAFVSACLIALHPAAAATRNWNGGGANNFWNNAANWGGSLPAAGDDLVFPGGGAVDVSSLNNTNDFAANTVFGSITVSGTNYTIGGNGIILTNGVRQGSGGTNTLALAIQVNANQTFQVSAPSGQLLLSGNLTLNRHLTNDVTGRLNLSGVISDSSDLVKIGTGTLRLLGTFANTFTGSTRVHAGLLELSKSVATTAIPGALFIGDSVGAVDSAVVRLLFASQIGNASAVTIEDDGLLDLNGLSDAIGALTLTGGDVSTGVGTLTLGGDAAFTNSTNTMNITGNLSLGNSTRTFAVATGPASPFISAQISGTGGLTKTGTGPLFLLASNSFAGPVTVNAGILAIRNSFALGTTNTGTLVQSNSTLQLQSSSQVGLEPLTLDSNGSLLGAALAVSDGSGSNSWSGDVVLLRDTTILVSSGAPLNLIGAIGGAGGLLKTGAGTLLLTGNSNNTYAGTTTVAAGTLGLRKGSSPGSYRAVPGDLMIGDNVGPASNAIVRLDFNHQIRDTADVLVNASGILDTTGDFETIGSLAGTGLVLVGAGQGLFFGGNDASTAFSGLIAGGPIFKQGSGGFTLTGNHSFSSLSLTEGSVVFNGTNSGSVLGYSNTVLTALGTVGNINMEVFGDGGGVLRPGLSPGLLHCGNLVLSPRATLQFELNGTTPGVGYDQLKVTGGVTLSNATLDATLNFTPAIGNSFTIIDNDGTDAITSTFAGLPEGARFNLGGHPFVITYAGGSGNDVVLSHVGTTRTWDGGGADNFWNTAANWDAPAVAGDALVFPGANVDPTSLVNTNNFPSGTAFGAITVSGTNFTLAGNGVALTQGLTHAGGGTNTLLMTLLLSSNQTISSTVAAGNLILGANLDLNGFTLTNDAVGLLSYTGVISGAGNLIKTGGGTLKLSGNSNNTYAGTTTVAAGTLALQKGSSPGSYRAVPGDVIIGDNVGPASNAIVRLDFNHQIADDAAVVVNNSGVLDSSGDFETIGSLAGSGVVLVGAGQGLFFGNAASTAFSGRIAGGPIFKNGTGTFTLTGNHAFSSLSVTAGGVVLNGTNTGSVLIYTNTVFTAVGSVGNVTMGVASSAGGLLRPGLSPGILNCGLVRLSPQATLEFELNGTTPGAGYDQLRVTGGLALSNATLNVNLGFASAISNSFTIIDNDGAEAVTNTFNGLPEGAMLLAGGTQFRISYTGGDGNDVVLTQLTGFFRPALTIERLPPSSIRLSWPTNGAAGFSLLANTNLSTTNWTAATPPNPVVVGTTWVVTNALSGQRKFYRLFKP